MDAPDHYRTLAAPVTGFYRDRGSKFISYGWPVHRESEIREKLDGLRREHPKARHVCYAWRLGTDGTRFRANDDGEPSGTAGRPILGQIDSAGLSQVLVAVVRYFGGTLLGAQGLIEAYKTSARDALEGAATEERLVEELIELTFPYPAMNAVMTLVKKIQPTIVEQEFSETPRLVVALRRALAGTFCENLEKIEGVSAQLLSE
jgi:uncharacterized YigZ family protein